MLFHYLFLQILNYTGLCKSDKGKIHPLFQTEMSYPNVPGQSSSYKTDSSSSSFSLVIWQIIFHTAGENKWHYCSLKTQTGTGLLWGSEEVKGGIEKVLLWKVIGQIICLQLQEKEERQGKNKLGIQWGKKY